MPTGSNFREGLFWLILRGPSLPWRGRNGSVSKRLLVMCTRIQEVGNRIILGVQPTFPLFPQFGGLAHGCCYPPHSEQLSSPGALLRHSSGNTPTDTCNDGPQSCPGTPPSKLTKSTISYRQMQLR